MTTIDDVRKARAECHEALRDAQDTMAELRLRRNWFERFVDGMLCWYGYHGRMRMTRDGWQCLDCGRTGERKCA